MWRRGGRFCTCIGSVVEKGLYEEACFARRDVFTTCCHCHLVPKVVRVRQPFACATQSFPSGPDRTRPLSLPRSNYMFLARSSKRSNMNDAWRSVTKDPTKKHEIRNTLNNDQEMTFLSVFGLLWLSWLLRLSVENHLSAPTRTTKRQQEPVPTLFLLGVFSLLLFVFTCLPLPVVLMLAVFAVLRSTLLSDSGLETKYQWMVFASFISLCIMLSAVIHSGLRVFTGVQKTLSSLFAFLILSTLWLQRSLV